MGAPTYRLSVPGKLFIAGEYAVLEPEGQCIVAAIDRYVSAEISGSDQNAIHLPQLGFSGVSWEMMNGQLQFSENAPKLTFIQNALRVSLQYIEETGVPTLRFSLSITSELDDASGKKYGLGSSAAVVVAVISSVLQFHEKAGIDLSKELIYKLASIAHFKTQGNGSCADIAASTYGGWLSYSAFHERWLHEEMTGGTNILSVVRKKWPGLMISSITPPSELLFCAGWTGSEMSTSPMIRKIQQLRDEQPSVYKRFFQDSQAAVKALDRAFREGNMNNSLQSLSDNREALMRLSDQANAEIETPLLKELIRIANRYGAGKTSGAGGGDCGIAFIVNDDNLANLKRDWQEAGIEPLKITVSLRGATVVGKGDVDID